MESTASGPPYSSITHATAGFETSDMVGGSGVEFQTFVVSIIAIILFFSMTEQLCVIRHAVIFWLLYNCLLSANLANLSRGLFDGQLETHLEKDSTVGIIPGKAFPRWLRF